MKRQVTQEKIQSVGREIRSTYKGSLLEGVHQFAHRGVQLLQEAVAVRQHSHLLWEERERKQQREGV